MALRQLVERHKAEGERNKQELLIVAEMQMTARQQAAAADAARHGLRRCALPSCDAQEAHPKLFKLCGRCRASRTAAPRTARRTGSATSARTAARLRLEDAAACVGCERKSHRLFPAADVSQLISL
jgi:hypothetical protein